MTTHANAGETLADMIDEIERGLEGTTPGPWWYEKWTDGTSGFLAGESSANKLSKVVLYMRDGDQCTEADGEHIARCSPDNIRALIAALRAQSAQPAQADATRREIIEECAWVAQKRADWFHTENCERGHTESDTNAFVCSSRGDCLCIEREEEAEAIATAIRALANAPSDKGEG